MILGLLFCINLLNYIDRYVLPGVLTLIEQAFPGISKERLGWLAPAFLIVYMVTSPIFGFLGDRAPRKLIVGLGVQLWSVATTAAAAVRSYRQLFLSRMAVGIGEAAYGTTAPTIIADLYPKAARGRALSFFYTAIPVGGALGYALGGAIGAHWGWRAAFLVVGLPGLLVGLAAYFIVEPARGASEGAGEQQLRRFLARAVRLRDYLALLRNRSFLLNTAGMAAYTYAVGGISYWMPTYLNQQRRLPVEVANFRFGLVTVATGLCGTLLGAQLADRLAKRIRGAYFLVSGVTMVLAFPAFYLALVSDDPAVYWPALVVAELLIFANTGPSNTIIANVTLPSLRTGAFAVNIFIIHALGDAISPVIMGAIADRSSLGAAFLSTSGVVILSGLLWLAGTPFLGRDTDRVLQEMQGAGTD